MDAAIRTGFRMSKFQIIRDILALDDVTAQQKLVLIAMNQYGDDGRNVYPSLHSIAKVCALGYRQVKRHARTLRDKGYLVPTGKSRLNTVNYRLEIPRDVSVPKVGSYASPSKGHERPPNTLNNIPSTYPPRVLGNKKDYFDSDSDYEGPKLDEYGRNTESIHEQAMRLHRARRQQT
jgi:hypothetical protein